MDEVIVGQASVGYRPSETTKRFRNKALGIAQVSPGSECCQLGKVYPSGG